MDNFSFNTAIARLMELVNALKKYETLEKGNTETFYNAVTTLIKLLAPCAPHFSEELWERLGNKQSIFLSDYPVFDEKALVRDEVEYGVQINSKLRHKIVLSNSLTQKEIEEIVLKDSKVQELLQGKAPKKVIVILKRLVNIIA